MEIKAVFFDIDGTLLNDRKNVLQSTQKAIKNLKKQGIFVGLATGRGPSFVQPYFENFGFDFAVTYNGQYIFTRNQVIYQSSLSSSTLCRLLRYANCHHYEISLGTASGLVGSHIVRMGTSRFGQVVSTIMPKRLSKMINSSFQYLIRRIKPQKWHHLVTILHQPIYQVVLIATEHEIDNMKTAFPDVTITRSSPYSADVVSKGQSKWEGIVRLGDVFGFKSSEVMVFGDSDNDVEMLSSAGIGIAMGNAKHSVKQLADYITDTNNNDGISKALSHYGLIHFNVEKRFESKDDNFNKVSDFHHLMDGNICVTPRPYGMTEAIHRADFKVEEIVEFLYATTKDDVDAFESSIQQLHIAIDKAVCKVRSKEYLESPLVGQADALIDLLYLTYGSFVLMGVDPKPIFDIVHESNMGKIFPDGKAHFDPVTHKILKPDGWEDTFAPEPAIKQALDRQIQKSLKNIKKSQVNH